MTETLLFLFLVVATSATLPDPSEAEAQDDYITIFQTIKTQQEQSSKSSASSVSSCWGELDDAWQGWCGEIVEVCGGSVLVSKDEFAVAPVGLDFTRGGVNGVAAETKRCVPFEEQEEDLDGAVAEAFARLPLPVPVVVSEPAGVSLVNLEHYVRGVVTDFDTTVELLDQQVRIRAYPVARSWDMGDGTTYERTTGSKGFPDGGVLHSFYRVGSYDMTVTVTWEGHYQPEDTDTWLPVNGQGQTTSEPEHISIEERRAYLGTPDDTDE